MYSEYICSIYGSDTNLLNLTSSYCLIFNVITTIFGLGKHTLYFYSTSCISSLTKALHSLSLPSIIVYAILIWYGLCTMMYLNSTVLIRCIIISCTLFILLPYSCAVHHLMAVTVRYSILCGYHEISHA